MIDPASLFAGLVIGGSIASIAVGLVASGHGGDQQDRIDALEAENMAYARKEAKASAQRREAGEKGRAAQAAQREAEKQHSRAFHAAMRKMQDAA